MSVQRLSGRRCVVISTVLGTWLFESVAEYRLETLSFLFVVLLGESSHTLRSCRREALPERDVVDVSLLRHTQDGGSKIMNETEEDSLSVPTWFFYVFWNCVKY